MSVQHELDKLDRQILNLLQSDATLPLKVVADEVGYGSEAALSRAFKAHCGLSPRAWKQQQAAEVA